MLKIRLISADDWKGIYFDGKLYMEGHDFPIRDIIEAIIKHLDEDDFDFKVVYTDNGYDDYDNDEYYLDKFGGRCPEEWPEELP